MKDFFDEQMMRLVRAKNPPPTGFFLQYFQNPLAVLRISELNMKLDSFFYDMNIGLPQEKHFDLD